MSDDTKLSELAPPEVAADDVPAGCMARYIPDGALRFKALVIKTKPSGDCLFASLSSEAEKDALRCLEDVSCPLDAC